MSTIHSFSGAYRFLSNCWPAPVMLDGDVYPSVEHAYQAAKFTGEDRKPFQNAPLKAGEAKRMGRGKGGPDWKEKSLFIMLGLLRQKFSAPDLKEKLLSTGNAELVEGNWWGDTFYGVCNGVGENHLGKMLMQVRKEYRQMTTDPKLAEVERAIMKAFAADLDAPKDAESDCFQDRVHKDVLPLIRRLLDAKDEEIAQHLEAMRRNKKRIRVSRGSQAV